jgi:hypothetical protein
MSELEASAGEALGIKTALLYRTPQVSKHAQAMAYSEVEQGPKIHRLRNWRPDVVYCHGDTEPKIRR